MPDTSFVSAFAYLVEWVKHIVTVGSALMLLGAALLKDMVKSAEAPQSYIIAALLVLSYGSMLVALWKGLALIRMAASVALKTGATTGDDLRRMQGLLAWAQGGFLASFALFTCLTIAVLLVWALGPVPPAVQPPYAQG